MKNLKIKDTVLNQEFIFYSGQRSNEAVIGSLEGFEYPSVRTSIEDISGPKSSLYVNSKFGRRIMSLTAKLFGNSTNTLLEKRRMLNNVIRQEGYMKLIRFTTLDDLELQCYAEITRMINNYNKGNNNLFLEMVAPDYRFYSQVEEDEEALPNVTKVVTNDGNDSTYPTYIITGPANGIIVDNLSLGLSFELSENLTGGQVLTIDTLEQTVVLGSSTNKFSIFSGDFFPLVPGNNSIELTASSTTGATKLQVVYRHAYSGV